MEATILKVLKVTLLNVPNLLFYSNELLSKLAHLYRLAALFIQKCSFEKCEREHRRSLLSKLLESKVK